MIEIPINNSIETYWRLVISANTIPLKSGRRGHHSTLIKKKDNNNNTKKKAGIEK